MDAHGFRYPAFEDAMTACSCIGGRTVREEIKHADAVLTGTIVAKQIIPILDPAFSGASPTDTTTLQPTQVKFAIARYDLLVSDVYKGNILTDTVGLYTGLGGGDCGVRFKVGERYIVYGEKETYMGPFLEDFPLPASKNAFWTHICLRTTSYDQAEIDEIRKWAKPKRRRR